MTTKFLAMIAVAFATAVSGTALARCDVGGVTLVGGTLSIDYDGFDPIDISASVPLTSSADPECVNSRVRFMIVTDDGRPIDLKNGLQLRNGMEVLQAGLEDRESRFRLSGSASAAAVVETRLNGVGAATLGDMILSIPRGQRVPPGTYIGQFRLIAEALDDSSDVVSRSDSLAVITVEVQPSVGLSAAWINELDLGTIQANGRAKTPLKFRAYANTRYDIVLTSDNAFDLHRLGEKQGPTIAYSPILSGETLSTGTDRTKAFSAPAGSDGFSDHTLDVIVPTLPARPAGEYFDVITVTIQPYLG